MKKSVYMALAALALVGCAKEVERTDAPAPLASRTVTITAGFDDATKTAYDAQGKFSWVAGDKIGVLVTNGTETKQVTFVTEDAGASATFTGEVEEGFQLAGVASYPFTGETLGYEGYACNDLAWDAEKGGWRIWGSIMPPVDAPLSCVPLIGTQKEDSEDYAFKTATGIVKFTVENTPAATFYAYLEVPDGYNLNGWYDISQTGYLSMANAVEPWGNRYNWNRPASDGATMEYYFFLPVGSLPAGSKFALCDENWAALQTWTFQSAVDVPRNQVVKIATLTFTGAQDEGWKSLGTGKFRDKFVWANAGLTDYAQVEFQQNRGNAAQFRIAKPYPGENSDEWFVFDITDPTQVASEPYFVDVNVTDEGKATFKPWVRNGIDYGYNYSDVLSWQTEGVLPAVVEIGPCYRGDDFLPDYNYDYEIGRDHERLAIEIVFPGCDPYPSQIALTADMISVNVDAGTKDGTYQYDGGGKAALVDGNTSTFWHTPWYDYESADYYSWADLDATYGAYIDIDLGEGKTVTTFQIQACLRNANSDWPKHVVVYTSADGAAWNSVADVADVFTANGAWINPIKCTGSAARYIRFSILTNHEDGSLTDPAAQACTHLAEIELYE